MLAVGAKEDLIPGLRANDKASFCQGQQLTLNASDITLSPTVVAMMRKTSVT